MAKTVKRDAKNGKFVSVGSFITEKRGYSAKAHADKTPPSSMMVSGKRGSVDSTNKK